MADIHKNFQSQPRIEPPEEDTLSLRDFPVTAQLQDQRRSYSQPSEFFEFFTDFANSEKFMSDAEDIIIHGKLVPFKEKHQMPIKPRNRNRRRSESMSELKSTNYNNSVPLVMRTSRSLDANTSLNSDRRDLPETIYRANSGKFKVPKAPRWLVLMFGAFKFPPEMNLRDIKNRQVRRTGSMSLFPSLDARDMMMPVNRSYRKYSWGLLDVLGCQGSASVAVTTSLSC